MKDWSLLLFLTQLGLTVAFPLAGFILLGVWLRDRFSLGAWVIWAGLAVGLCCAVTGFRDTLRQLRRMTEDGKKDPPPVSYNDHI